MYHTQIELDTMPTFRLRNFILGFCLVGSTKQLKEAVPGAKGFDLRKKGDCLQLYSILTQSKVSYYNTIKNKASF